MNDLMLEGPAARRWEGEGSPSSAALLVYPSPFPLPLAADPFPLPVGERGIGLMHPLQGGVSYPFRPLSPEGERAGPYFRKAACAAARRAIGTRYGLAET